MRRVLVDGAVAAADVSAVFAFGFARTQRPALRNPIQIVRGKHCT
jgi:hypothetical protein